MKNDIFFDQHAKKIHAFLSNDKKEMMDDIHYLSDLNAEPESFKGINIFTLIPYTYDADFMALELQDWQTISEKVIFPEHFDFNQLFSTFWQAQPVVLFTDVSLGDVYKHPLVHDALCDIHFGYSRDLAAEYAPENAHYLNQAFDLDKLAHHGIYLQGHCYSIKQCVATPHALPEQAGFIIPIFNIHSMDTSEIQQIIVFDKNGFFLDCVVGTDLIR